jgi:membrane-bound lytic murein transglycosylase D
MFRLRASPLRLAFVAFMFFSAEALSVDFKIDLPAEMGVRPSTNAPRENLGQANNFDFPDDLGVDSNFAPGRQNEVPARAYTNTPSNEAVLDVSPAWSQSAKLSDSRFPTPKCLVERVKFWEMVYRDIDVDSVLLHDRENLGRVYGMARLAADPKTRSYAADVYRNYYSDKLKELAAIYNMPAKWDSAHRTLAGAFPGRELTAENLLLASRNIRVQSGLKRHFEHGISRSLPILSTVHSIIVSHGIPEDIVVLPHVESGYSTRAVSKVGAVGLWQIMPDTMRMLMGKNSVSRRTEVHASTIAAAKLLRLNYQKTGSWPLALTAYNHGLNGVMRAVRSTGSRDLCTIIERYESRSFRFASSNFYAQFLAARNVALPRYATLVKSEKAPKVLKPMLSKRLGVSF